MAPPPRLGRRHAAEQRRSMHVTGSRRTARLGRAICAFLGGVILAGAVAACGESNRFTHLAPTPKPTPVVVQLLVTVPRGRTMPPVAPSPPARTPETVTTMAPPTPTVTVTPTQTVTPTPTPTAQPSERPLTPVEAGRQLFVANSCNVCHGDDLSGGIGPLLAGRTPDDLPDDRIRSQEKEGGNGMPSFPHLTEAEIDQIIAFIRAS